MKGNIIYNPSGKAGEYSYWAANFYNGCSADCEYCYCKKGVLKSFWSTTPTIKKSLGTHERAMAIFKLEVRNNVNALREHGLFFNFTSDPFLRETIDLNYDAIQFCNVMGVPVKALTKQTWWIEDYDIPDNVTIGFTLTGHDEMEPRAASTEDRIKAIERLWFKGYKIWASIEPVIDFDRAFDVIRRTAPFVYHYKIGPISGGKFSPGMTSFFMDSVNRILPEKSTVYWKEGFVEKMGFQRDCLGKGSVDRDYRWWA